MRIPRRRDLSGDVVASPVRCGSIGGILAMVLVLASTGLAQDLVLGTYNLRNDNAGDIQKGDGWARRAPVIAGQIQFHGFDVLGTQEGKHNQLEDLVRLTGDYAYIGVGRDDGKQGGEFSAIFYRKDALALLESGNFWLSATKDRPSLGWDASYRRICTWGKFEQKRTEFVFYIFNAHFDHKGVIARRESARLMVAQAKAIAGEAPMVVMGDLNSDQHSEHYRTITGGGWLVDAFDAARIKYVLNGTFNGFKSDSWTTSRIDHIFLSRIFRVKRYGVLTDSYRAPLGATAKNADAQHGPKEIDVLQYVARMPSDHFPVLVETSGRQ